METAARFQEALRRFDEANAADPHLQEADGAAHPHEWLDAQRLHGWVMRLCPQAGEALQLASRCQHIRRWESPRDAYPMTRAGYHQWRTYLKKFHAETAGRILRECGYEEEMILRVQALNLKKNFPADPEAQTLEDALCLTFLQWEYAGFAGRFAPEKVVHILRRTWGKMSPRAHEEALRLPFDGPAKEMISRALAPDDSTTAGDA
jgi:hypothetical protein